MVGDPIRTGGGTAELTTALRADYDAAAADWAGGPEAMYEALAATPQTFVHSNFKLDNLGTDDAGRTVLLDWEQPGRGAPLSDLAWYLAINCRRLPQSKEASIAAYREELEGCGIDTGPPCCIPPCIPCCIGGICCICGM